MLLISYFMSSISTSIGDLSGSRMLNQSIPSENHKSNIFANVESKGLSRFYFLSAASELLSGFLYLINPYIPFIICATILIIATRVATLFSDIPKTANISNENVIQEYDKYFKNLKKSFKITNKSKRIKALILYATLLISIILVMASYEKGLLEELNVSAAGIGAIYATMQVIAGLASREQKKLNKKFGNKTLSIIGISYTGACLIAGLIAITNIPYAIILGIVILTYGIRYIGKGSFQVLIKRYITNFTNTETANEAYSAYGVITGIGAAVIGILASIIVSNHNLKYSMIIFGILSIMSMIAVLMYMKTRVGLTKKDYERDIKK